MIKKLYSNAFLIFFTLFAVHGTVMKALPDATKSEIAMMFSSLSDAQVAAIDANLAAERR